MQKLLWHGQIVRCHTKHSTQNTVRTLKYIQMIVKVCMWKTPSHRKRDKWRQILFHWNDTTIKYAAIHAVVNTRSKTIIFFRLANFAEPFDEISKFICSQKRSFPKREPIRIGSPFNWMSSFHMFGWVSLLCVLLGTVVALDQFSSDVYFHVALENGKQSLSWANAKASW